MGFLKKVFGGGDPLSAIQRAVRQQRWADALREGECLEKGKLSSAVADECDSLLELAGNQLAETNLCEGEACYRAGENERAKEHFVLAAQHARADQLKQRAAQLLQELESPSGKSGLVPIASGCCSSGCQTEGRATPGPTFDLDLETRLELALSSYPPEWVERYCGAGSEFKQALLLSHDGLLNEALDAFETVPDASRDELFYFERGSLRIRMNDHGQGRHDLLRAIDLNPRHELALETLASLDLSSGSLAAAEERLQAMLSSGISPVFCYSRLAMLSAGRGDEATAIAYGEKALAAGSADPEMLALQSSLLEKNGRLEEAEALLARLPAGGCGGGGHVLLAEFWVRHGKFLEKALVSFKGASRQEPENPRWPMRIAQAYLALGWHKEGQAMMRNVLSFPQIDDVLRREAEEILRNYGK